MTYTARRLRREMTLPEVLLWKALRTNAEGLRFRRQHQIDGYIADFCCISARLVIEIDGKAHDMGSRPERDVARTRYLEEKGFQVVRIPATDVLKDAAAVADAVARLASPVRQPLRGCHLPASGEDLA